MVYQPPKMNIGRFFVIDGTDGTGKTTQIKLLKNRLEEAGFKVKMADFPQYNSKSAGLVEEYLSGKYGNINEVSPYAASLFYACDRFDASRNIKTWLQNGYIVLSNRYTSANLGHQGAKIPNPLARRSFYEWIENIEYKILKNPRPDKTIILRIPAEIAQSFSRKRQRVDWEGKIKDIHEENLNHLKTAENIFIEISEHQSNTGLINCIKNDKILDRTAVNDLIWNEIKDLLPKNTETRIEEAIYAPNFLNTEKGSTPKKPQVIKINNNKKPKYSIDITIDHDQELKTDKIYNIKTGFRTLLPENYLGYVVTPKQLLNKQIKIETQILHPNTDSELVIRIKNNTNEPFNIYDGQTIAQVLFQKLEPINEEE